jgi:CheY-like chemotaxis protein
MTKTILLADDSLTIQKVVELTFADTQYHVVSVSSGDELLEKLPEIRPEVVICDIIMPGRDGYDVCMDIKSNSDTLHIPVILLSGTFEPFDRDRALAAGCSEIITKPFEAKRLVDAVEKLFSTTADGAEASAPTAEPAPGLEPAPATRDEDFGTQLSAQPDTDIPSHDEEESSAAAQTDDDGIDFTTSGFAEMEAAAEQATDPQPEVTDTGIDFEVATGPESIHDGDFEAADDEHFADAFSTDEAPSAADETATDPFSAADGPAAEGIFGDPVDEPFSDPAPEDLEDGEPAAPPASDFDLKTAEEAFAEDPAPVVLSDADTAPVPPIEDVDAGDDDHDTTEAVEAVPAVDREPDASAGDDAPRSPLSDDDVERIARRVIELAFDRIEQVAWEVIPDVAEVAVRDRIRQLESEFETEN